MRRRDFLQSAMTWPMWSVAARGQQSKIARIGGLYLGIADGESFKRELREGLQELGYVDGQNIAFEFRDCQADHEPAPEPDAEPQTADAGGDWQFEDSYGDSGRPLSDLSPKGPRPSQGRF